MDLSLKISELSGGQSHMLRINGCARPLILRSLFSALDKLDFGDGKVAGPIVSWPFGAVHYVWGWGKVSMWLFRRALQLLKERNSLIALCSPLRINVQRGSLPRHKKSQITHATTSLRGRILVRPHLRLSAHLNQCLLGLPGSDTAAHAEPAMQATRTPSVFADCSIPAGLRIGPVPGIFKLGKYVSDRKDAGVKKRASYFDLFARE